MTASPDEDVSTLSFEEAMKELERVVTELENGDVTLDTSIALYERGARLREHCDARLREAEERIERITLAGGRPTGTAPVEGL